MEISSVLAIIIGSFWAAANTLLKGLEMCSKMRDRILDHNNIENHDSIEQLRFILERDWLWLRGGLGFISLVFGLLIVSTPYLMLPSERPILIICISSITAACPLLSTVHWWVGGYLEYKK